MYKRQSIIISTESNPEIPQEVLSSLEDSENIESVIPVTVRQIAFSVPGSTTHAAVFAAAENDLPYLTHNFQIAIADGRLPESGADEIAVDSSVAKNNGYDSFLMFNVYAQRATRPNDIERVCNEALHRANMEAFDYILSLSEQPAVWAAWGNIIEQRAYLKDCLADMIAIGERHGAQWYTCLLYTSPSPRD